MTRRSVVSLAALSSVVLFADLASAQAVSDKSSSATAPLIWRTRDSFFNVGTSLGDSDVALEVGFSFQPEPDPQKDLLRVDMSKGALIEASWGDDKNITIKSLGTQQKEGVFSAEYVIKPGVEITVDAGAFGTFNKFWDASGLLNKAPGSKFDPHSKGQSPFEPWGWNGAQFTIPSAPMAESKIVSTTFEALGASKSTIEGNIAVAMTTTPKFTYKTTSIQLDANKPLTKEGEELQIPTIDADYLEVEALVKGRLDYEGNMVVRPVVEVTSIAGFNLPFTIDLAGIADAQVPYGNDKTKTPGDLDGPLAVNFPKATFHIALPNVKVRTKSLDMGTVTLGQEVKKTVQIDNTGEMGATVEFESTDPQFKVGKATQIAIKGKYELEVLFVPQNAGPAAGKILVKSNDPNESKVEINVTANGAKPLAAPPPKAEEPPAVVATPGSDSGCGCDGVGQKKNQTTTLLGGALFARGLAGLQRRRRT